MHKNYAVSTNTSFDRNLLIAEGLMLMTKRALSLAIKASNYGDQSDIELQMDRAKAALTYRREFVG